VAHMEGRGPATRRTGTRSHSSSPRSRRASAPASTGPSRVPATKATTHPRRSASGSTSPARRASSRARSNAPSAARPWSTARSRSRAPRLERKIRDRFHFARITGQPTITVSSGGKPTSRRCSEIAQKAILLSDIGLFFTRRRASWPSIWGMWILPTNAREWAVHLANAGLKLKASGGNNETHP
jgi:hypothetical protein